MESHTENNTKRTVLYTERTFFLINEIFSFYSWINNIIFLIQEQKKRVVKSINCKYLIHLPLSKKWYNDFSDLQLVIVFKSYFVISKDWFTLIVHYSIFVRIQIVVLSGRNEVVFSLSVFFYLFLNIWTCCLHIFVFNTFIY